ncbi:MAG: hypothetical protein HOE19_00650 [Candidatus Komeilibacteria bacterium]|jgi:broad specificity phosphatase PhoE|nr:hypothetical protein [Candidatus Komeilibacteria bacterium]MBT4447361.1 hypothetical protein [Candidatus Komeilibacteria bacterium]
MQKFNTVAQVLAAYPENVVMIERHGSYLMNPEGANNPEDGLELAAQNYARVYPDHHNPLDQNGRSTSVRQGHQLAETGVEIDQILVSRQGRGPETGLYMGLGFLNGRGTMPSINHCLGADYPVYSSAKLVKDMLAEHDDWITVRWLNGLIPGFCTETPEEFMARVEQMVADIFANGQGLTLVASHFEIITYAQIHWVAKEQPGEISDDFVPAKSGGVILFQEDGEIRGLCYDPDLNIME